MLASDTSVFDLFRLGIGPSSSHTVGPMRAARQFLVTDVGEARLAMVARVTVALHGSLALTARGHRSDVGVLLGLMGQEPETVETEVAEALIASLRARGRLRLLGRQEIGFDETRDLMLVAQPLAHHPNGMCFSAFDAGGALVAEACYYSIGGGFVVSEAECARGSADAAPAKMPYTFATGAALLQVADGAGLSIAELIRANEVARFGAETVANRLAIIRRTMLDCIERGLATEGELPGGLSVRRRAAALQQRLQTRNSALPHNAIEWVSLWAIAVNEENAAGGRVVTAPTNGAAGVVPAVLRYWEAMCAPDASAAAAGSEAFLLTAGAVGALCKANASISGAEVGCQGEVGVASAMAAAGLTAALGGSNAQVENAAEIALEHHLGLTCDPVGGLVQVPCIERNAMGAIKAVNAASLALAGDGTHRVSLDQAIETMRQTGLDMASKYKETALGGLALNVTSC